MPWLQRRLKDLAVRTDAASALVRALAELGRLQDAARNGAPWSAEDVRRTYMAASGADFLTKALERGAWVGLRGFDGHYPHIASGNPVLTAPTGESSKARNESWELLLASLLATFAIDVTPEEPDIRATFEGRRVGVAAKVLYSQNIDKQLERICEGARQLRNQAECDEGYVVVNAVELFPHERMFENLKTARFAHNDELIHLMGAWSDAFMTAHDLARWGRKLGRSTKVAAVAFFWPTLLLWPGRDNPLAPYYGIHYVAVEGREDQASRFFTQLTRSCDSVLSWNGSDTSRDSLGSDG